jgi:uncharacterized membrane protein YeaQ/YmgE (transglycosylase-associated protein family)
MEGSPMLGIEAGEAIACVAGAVLAEGVRPAESWKGSVWNVLLGIAAGSYGPLGIELYMESLAKAHRLVTFLCAFVGSSILKYLGEQAAERKFLDWIPILRRIAEAFRKPPEEEKK